MSDAIAVRGTSTSRRVKLSYGGSLEIVTTPGNPIVMIIADAQRVYVSVDVTPSEAKELVEMLQGAGSGA